MDIPSDYLNDDDLKRGVMVVETSNNGKSDEAFWGDVASSRQNGSFHKDKLPKKAFDRFIRDGYIEPVQGLLGWFRKSR